MANEIKLDYDANFSKLLTLMFIYLKLTKAIAWSWLWVLSPIWISLLVAVVVAVFIAIVQDKLTKW